MDEKLKRSLVALSRLIESPKPILNRIGAYQQERLKTAFERGVNPETAQPWPSLSPSTIANKKANKNKPLIESEGRIPKSLFYRVRGRAVEVGYEHPLAAIHHVGATLPARTVIPKSKRALYWAGAPYPVARARVPASTLPARPLVGFSPQDVEAWKDIAQDEINLRLERD